MGFCLDSILIMNDEIERYWNEDKRFWVRAEKITWGLVLFPFFFLATFGWPSALVSFIIWNFFIK